MGRNPLVVVSLASARTLHFVSYPHADLHTPGWMGQVEMALEWLMGGGGGRFQWLDSLPPGNN